MSKVNSDQQALAQKFFFLTEEQQAALEKQHKAFVKASLPDSRKNLSEQAFYANGAYHRIDVMAVFEQINAVEATPEKDGSCLLGN